MQDRIKQMAREAGMVVNDDWVGGHFLADLEKFAQLVAEDCAKEFDQMADDARNECLSANYEDYLRGKAAAIRARYGIEGA